MSTSIVARSTADFGGFTGSPSPPTSLRELDDAIGQGVHLGHLPLRLHRSVATLFALGVIVRSHAPEA